MVCLAPALPATIGDSGGTGVYNPETQAGVCQNLAAPAHLDATRFEWPTLRQHLYL
jgi:hypothetical protein